MGIIPSFPQNKKQKKNYLSHFKAQNSTSSENLIWDKLMQNPSYKNSTFHFTKARENSKKKKKLNN